MTENAAVKPCRSMRNAVDRIARGERGGLWLLYARLHTMRCRRCQAAIEALRAYLKTMKGLREQTSPEFDMSKLQLGLDELDRTKASPRSEV